MSLKSIQELVSIYPEYNFMRNMWEFQNSCFETPFSVAGYLGKNCQWQYQQVMVMRMES